MNSFDSIENVLKPVTDELSRLGIRYYVGGSVASSIHGVARSTMDVDLSTELTEAAAFEFTRTVQPSYYVSEPSVISAVRRKSCFNLVHYATSCKVDLFVSRQREFDLSVFRRAYLDTLTPSSSYRFSVVTAEDILLLKFEWYRLGGDSSERQWNDVTGVAKLNAHRLDHEYLGRWADELGVRDLWNRLLREIRA